MSDSIRVTKTSPRNSKTCYDGLLLGLIKEKNLCLRCRSYYDLPVKKKPPQAAMGRTYSQCLLRQEEGMSLPSVELSSERQREPVYCQVLSTSSSTKRALPFSSIELSSKSRGRPSMKATVEAMRASYSSRIEFYQREVLELQEATAHLQLEVIQAQKK